MNLLPANLASVADMAADESGRYSMTGVHLRVTDTSYTAEATDGRVAVRVTGPCDSPADYPAIAALAVAPNGATEALIPAGDWRAAFKAVPKQPKRWGKPILRNVAVVLGSEVSTLATTDGTEQSVSQPKHVEGRFPDLDTVQPKDPAVVTIDFNPAQLLRVLKAALAFTTEDNQRCTLTIYPPSKPAYGCPSYPPARIVVHNGEQTFDALVMPLS